MSNAIEKEMATFLAQQPPAKLTTLKDSPLNHQLAKMKQGIRSAMDELKLSGITPKDREAMHMQIMEAARADLAEVLQSERCRVSAEVAKLERIYNRDAELNRTRYDSELTRYSNRVAAMDAEELKMEMIQAVSGGISLRPEALDILSRELKTTAPTDHGMLRSTIREKQLDKPWLHQPEGQDLVQYANVLDHNLKSSGELPQIAEGRVYATTLEQFLEADE
jgi:hypothetical protein